MKSLAFRSIDRRTVTSLSITDDKSLVVNLAVGHLAIAHFEVRLGCAAGLFCLFKVGLL